MDDSHVTGAKKQEEIYEHAFDSVPKESRKSLFNMFIVLAGYPIALSNFVIGGTVGVGLTIEQALLSLLIGNAILIAIVILTGIIAFRTGKPTALVSRRAFGASGSFVFAGLLTLSAITWVSLNADIFARLIAATFPGWPLAISITAILVVFIWLQSAMRGFKGLSFISKLGVPAALIMSAWGTIAVYYETAGFAGLAEYVPESPISLTAATAAIVGGWVFGASSTPDVCRYAKSEKDVIIAGLGAFLVGCFGLQLAGALIAITTGIGDFTAAMAALGLVMVAFIAAIFCLWTTQDNNIYIASLAMQNIIKETKYHGQVKHWHLAVFVGAVAAVFAALGIYTHILPVISYLALLIPPVPGLLIAEEFIIKQPKENMFINYNAIAAWIIGSGVALYFFTADIFIPPLGGILASFIGYIILSKVRPVKASDEQLSS